MGFAQDTSAILVSEGVETKAERDTLMDLGVTMGQGYLLGRPLPVQEARRSHRPRSETAAP